MIEYIKYDTDGSLLDKQSWKYDSNGNQIEWSRLDESGNSYVYLTRDYNSNNDLLLSKLCGYKSCTNLN